MKLKVVLEPSDDGGPTVFVPALPGCISEEESKEEAIKNIREARPSSASSWFSFCQNFRHHW